MKQDRFPTLVIATVLLAIPAYSGAQQAGAEAAARAAKATATPATGKAATATAEADKAASATANAVPVTKAAGPAASVGPEAVTSAMPTPAAGPAAAVATDPAKAVGITPETASAAPAPTIAPEAAAALKRASDFLQGLKAFNVRIDSSTDEVLALGEKVQFGSLLDVSVVKPDRLRVDVVDDARQRQFYYDGKSLALYGKAENYYASVAAPGTIAEMLAFAESKYGLALPVADLLAPESLAQKIKSGIHLGKSRVRGMLCDQYAFRQDDVDWQIWIQEGKTPLPRKIVITTRGEPGAPQHESLLSWNLSPKLPDSAFHFFPPKSARRIIFRELESKPDTTTTRTSINREMNVNVSRKVTVDADRSSRVGSMVTTLPTNCVPHVHRGLTYQQCGEVYYQPQYSGSSLTYEVVGRPG